MPTKSMHWSVCSGLQGPNIFGQWSSSSIHSFSFCFFAVLNMHFETRFKIQYDFVTGYLLLAVISELTQIMTDMSRDIFHIFETLCSTNWGFHEFFHWIFLIFSYDIVYRLYLQTLWLWKAFLCELKPYLVYHIHQS